jgi:hypothetical protein
MVVAANAFVVNGREEQVPSRVGTQTVDQTQPTLTISKRHQALFEKLYADRPLGTRQEISGWSEGEPELAEEVAQERAGRNGVEVERTRASQV